MVIRCPDWWAMRLVRRSRGDGHRSTTGIRAAVGEALLSRLRCQARVTRSPRVAGLLSLRPVNRGASQAQLPGSWVKVLRQGAPRLTGPE